MPTLAGAKERSFTEEMKAYQIAGQQKRAFEQGISQESCMKAHSGLTIGMSARRAPRATCSVTLHARVRDAFWLQAQRLIVALTDPYPCGKEAVGAGKMLPRQGGTRKTYT